MSGLDSGTPRRIGAVILRHWYLIAGSWPRFLDLCYWPLVQMVLWGFIQTFLMQQSSFFAQAGGILRAAVMLARVHAQAALLPSIEPVESPEPDLFAEAMISPHPTQCSAQHDIKPINQETSNV